MGAKVIADWVNGDKVITVSQPSERSDTCRVSLMADVKFGENGTREGVEIANTQYKNAKEALAEAERAMSAQSGEWIKTI